MNLVFILAVILLSAAMIIGGLAASWLFAPKVPSALKSSAYECGETPVGNAQVQLKIGYYLVALLFLIFDVEALFLYPWAVSLRQAGWVGFSEIGAFVAVLVLGLAYAYKKGALEWNS